ncbi:hypothetical protein KPH14_008030 [Odynerus spinipes]|uniref:RING-type E3 ubiquitin transferase (cysteine targeting) n=1 Tax=Odynerus spinipes TaxID=1348599 RepID=A0AAD9VPG4_9HYME|nr:hypothetical protein KPH14_008030 [Odynerus spinipes]
MPLGLFLSHSYLPLPFGYSRTFKSRENKRRSLFEYAEEERESSQRHEIRIETGREVLRTSVFHTFSRRRVKSVSRPSSWKKMSSPYVSRVNQLDATQLDDEIYKVFENQTKEIFKYFPPGKIDRWQPEIKALLRILIWNFSLRSKGSTLGQQMLDLHYSNLNKGKSFLYLVFKLVPKYVKDRVIDSGIASSPRVPRKFKFYVRWMVGIIHLLKLVNLIVFLHRGSQPLLIERLLNISSVSKAPNKPRNIGYSYMTRELLWHGLMELFTLGIPMLNYHYLKQTIRRLWNSKSRGGIKRTYPIMNDSTVCAYCKERPILPTHAGCEHIFCYYCLCANFTAMKVFLCPECDTELHDCDMKNYIAFGSPTINSDNDE